MTASNKINRINLEKEFKGVVNNIYEKTQMENSMFSLFISFSFLVLVFFSFHSFQFYCPVTMPNRTDEQVLQEIIAQYSPGLFCHHSTQ